MSATLSRSRSRRIRSPRLVNADMLIPPPLAGEVAAAQRRRVGVETTNATFVERAPTLTLPRKRGRDATERLRRTVPSKSSLWRRGQIRAAAARQELAGFVEHLRLGDGELVAPF